MSHPNKPARPRGSPTPELLPNELLWADGGHASDIVLTALADGQQEIVPDAVLAHIERCTTCTTHLGHAALLSIHAGAELVAGREHERLTARRPLPRLAIALGLAVAAVGLLPSVLDGTGDVAAVRTFVSHDIPLFLKGIGTLARRVNEPGSSAGLLVTYAAAGMFVLMGFALVRLLPRSSFRSQKETSR